MSGTSESTPDPYPVAEDRDLVRAAARSLFVASDIVASPTFERDRFAVTADYLVPNSPAGYALVFVREGSGLKDAYLVEAALALYCAEHYDEPPRRVLVYYLRKSYVRGEELDPDGLFVPADVTRRATARLATLREDIATLAATLEVDPCLDGYADQRCARPETCSVCSQGIRPFAIDHVLTLHRGGEFARSLFARGVSSILALEPDELAHDRQRIQQRALRTGRPQIDTDAIVAFVASLEYPISFLDFEAINEPVPTRPGLKPWEHVPFLYSIHRQAGPDQGPEHRSAICMPSFADHDAWVQRLLKDLGDHGSIVVYGAAFERSVFARLGAWFPAHQDALAHASARIIDLQEPFVAFAFYDAAQRGKVSLKRVLPALTGRDYSELSVQDGLAANRAFRYLQSHPDLPETERDRITADLIAYCAMDTAALVLIMERLREVGVENG